MPMPRSVDPSALLARISPNCAQGLGQPGQLRATIMGQAVFYGLTTACFIEISALDTAEWATPRR